MFLLKEYIMTIRILKKNNMNKDVYYKVTVTKDDMECTVYWWEKTYNKLMESIDILYHISKVDAIELEMITREEYDRNFV